MRKRHGFTLIELLVVISIMVLLISLLLPSLEKARESARDVSCLSTIRQMQLASAEYAEENGGWYIPVLPYFDASGATTSIWWSEGDATRQALSITPVPEVYYGSSPARMICPDASYALASMNPDRSYSIRASYGMNFQDFIDPGMFPDLTLYPSAGKPAKYYCGYKVSQVRNPGEKIAWADALWPWIRCTGSTEYVGETRAVGNCVTAYRHHGGANIAFFDGHASWMPRSEIDVTNMTQPQIYRRWYAYLDY